MDKVDLSVLIPARGEEFLGRTIQDLLEHIEGNTEIIAILDGYLPNPPLPSDPRVTVIYHPESVGQRKAANDAAKLAKGKYLMKVDAHVAFDQGFDVKMLDAFKETGDNVTMIPQMKNLHAFDWVCKNGHRRYQSPSGPCETCKEPTTKDVVWIVKHNPTSRSFCFDSEPHFQYFGEYNNRPESKVDISESMSIQGSCFMCTKEKYFELDFNSDEFNSWGSQGIEIAAKTWLSGGRVLVNKRTWYCHLFRTRGSDFGFPYHNPESKIRENKKKARDLFFGNIWPQQIRPLSWLIKKFWPIKGWQESDLTQLLEAEAMLPDLRKKELGVLGVVSSIPSPMADHTTPFSPDGSREQVSIPTMGLSGISGSSTIPLEDIVPVGDKLEVGGVTTKSVVADVIQDRNVPSLPVGNRADEPGIHESVGSITNLVDSHIPITTTSGATSPNPASSIRVDSNFSEDSTNGLERDVHNTSIPQKGICYYSDNTLDGTKLGEEVKRRLKKISEDKKIPITTACLKKIDLGVKNVYFPSMKRGIYTMFKQILGSLENSTADIVFLCEADVLYDQSHFDFTPPSKDIYYYNQNNWQLRVDDGFAVYFDCKRVSQCCAYRELLITHYRKRLKMVEEIGFTRAMGFEPGSHNRPERVDDVKSDIWVSAVPSIDLAHGNNVTSRHWKPEDFRSQRNCQNWKQGYEIPGWGQTSEIIKLLK